MRIPMVLVLITFLTAAQAQDRRFLASVKLLDEKADMCIRSANSKSSGYCDDFESYYDYLFKGDPGVWGEAQLANGNVNASNIEQITKLFNKCGEAHKVSTRLSRAYLSR